MQSLFLQQIDLVRYDLGRSLVGKVVPVYDGGMLRGGMVAMSGDLDLCNLVAVDDVVGNGLPRRIRRLIVFLLHLPGEE